MSTQNIKQLLNDLQSVSDSTLEKGLRTISINIDENRFHNAFSTYGLSKLLAILDRKTLHGKLTYKIPDDELERIRWTGVFLIKTYVSLVYMRSEVLERGLDTLPPESPLLPFRDAFRSGCLSRGEDTIVQHIRNALAHGNFNISKDVSTVTFNDRNWTASFTIDDVLSLCDQVFRFYVLAFNVNHGLPSKSTVSD